MARSASPLFPTDEGWPYPDGIDDRAAPDELDLDALELRADPHAFDGLTADERIVLSSRFGLDGTDPCSMKELSRRMGRPRGEIRETLGRGIDKLRDRIVDER